MRGWRAFYADGREFPSAETRWPNLPPEGCVGVVVYLASPYRRILDGYDWIYLRDGELHTVDTHPEWGKWTPRPPGVPAELLKLGAGMEDEAWADMQRRMMEARRCP